MNFLMKVARFSRPTMTVIAGLALAGAGFAQTVQDDQVPNVGLDIPTNLQIFGKLDPNIRKPTAIVNDTVITGTDVDQRVALIEAANNQKVPAEQLDQLKLQILRQLIDETLQIQEAKTEDITITPDEINQSYSKVAANFNKKPGELRGFLKSVGSSERSLKRQIEGELAWQRYLRRRVEPFVNVGEEEVNAILARLKAQKGTEEYHIREIYLSATPDRAQQVFSNARQVIQEIQKGEKPFEFYASSVSEATTRSVGGDLGWVKPATLPDSLAEAAASMQVGQVAGPIEVPGGFSIIYLIDKRQVLTADPRDARLALKQLTVRFPAGTTQAQATAQAEAFGKTIQTIRGCGDVAKIAASLNAEVVDNDSVTVRDLPPPLQDILLKLQVGQSSPPFGSAQDGLRALVLCGRDDPHSGELPPADQIQGQMEQARVNLRAQQKLRDLRRDAIIEYR